MRWGRVPITAEAVEDLCVDRPVSRVGALARHWIAAEPTDIDKAIRTHCA